MADSICVGVAVHAEPDRLLETLRQLARHTGTEVSVVLLPDGPDEPTAEALRSHGELTAYPQRATSAPQGGAACLNRLTAQCTADVVVLLESGALVGPGWLELLLAALRRPGCGLAGPSTNRCWNEQAIFPNARGNQADVRRVAGEALRRYGRAVRSLAPLYSLADFCYAVHREVLDAAGGADEGYGLAPCWEMDLNVRAARAGFSGVWVGGAYVYRSPVTARRSADEERLLEAGKRRYQDRFCGLRLTGRADQYRPHCDGDACDHFAPREMMPGRPRPGKTRPAPSRHGLARLGTAGTTPTSRAAQSRQGRLPLVSCIMPTRDRPEFALQAVRYFQRQDWPATELIIVEDGPPLLACLLPDDPRIKLVPSGTSRSIGSKRNLACEMAQGEVIAQWDDDDWYGPERLSRQVGPIVAGDADITALRDCLLFDVRQWQFWRLSDDLHRRMLVRDVHGGTLVFRHQIWENLVRYPDRSLAEDAAFLDQAMRRRARLRALRAAGLYVYIRHDGNSWRFECGRAMDPKGWQRADESAFPAEDRAFYRQYSVVAAAPRPEIAASQQPWLSNRPGFPSLPATSTRLITTIER
jgi:O-antigen biosynthesis protein